MPHLYLVWHLQWVSYPITFCKPIIDRIYYDTLLADPAINELERFTVQSIRQNQKEDAQLSIIRDFVDAVDVNETVETLPAALRRDVKEGKYVIEDKNDLLVFPDKLGNKRIVLPREHQKALLIYYHTNQLSGGHGGLDPLLKEIQKNFYWRGFTKDCKEFIERCKCQLAKNIPSRRMGAMKLFPAKFPNDSVAVDHIGMLQESGGYRYITTYYDRFSGFAVSRPVRCIDALTTAFTFMSAWVTMFGAPNSLLSDNGSDFRSELFGHCLLYTSPSPRDKRQSRMPSSA